MVRFTVPTLVVPEIAKPLSQPTLIKSARKLASRSVGAGNPVACVKLSEGTVVSAGGVPLALVFGVICTPKVSESMVTPDFSVMLTGMLAIVPGLPEIPVVERVP